jgi:hypothetical protein
MKRSLTLLTLLIAVLLLLGAPVPWGSLDLGVAPAYAQDLPGGQTIGGPGVHSRAQEMTAERFDSLASPWNGTNLRTARSEST